MSMRKSVARELRMLREIAHFFLPQHTCCFCGEKLMIWDELAFDNHKPKPVTVKITFHHSDGHPEGNVKGKRNNKRENMDISHRTCHKSHELKRQHELRKLKKCQGAPVQNSKGESK